MTNRVVTYEVTVQTLISFQASTPEEEIRLIISSIPNSFPQTLTVGFCAGRMEPQKITSIRKLDG